MGHACEILTFDAKTTHKAIEIECGEWAGCNCDRRENPHGYDRLNINFTDKVFDSYEDACDYLDTTWGDYRQIAVQYYKYPQFKPTKAMLAIKEQIKKYDNLIAEIDKPHYANPNLKSITVKCKGCGAVLPTKYCGKSYDNHCPICNGDLRPSSMIEKRSNYSAKVRELCNKLGELERAERKKLKGKSTRRWAVACEVHC